MPVQIDSNAVRRNCTLEENLHISCLQNYKLKDTVFQLNLSTIFASFSYISVSIDILSA